MSRFMEALRDELTGNRKPILEPLSVVETRDPLTVNDIRTLQEHKFKVVWSVTACCAPKDREAMLKNVYRELREAVYGHLTDRLRRLERAVYEHDDEKVRMHIRDLWREIDTWTF